MSDAISWAQETQRDTNQDECPKIHIAISFSNYRKSEIKKKIMKEAREKKHLT